MQQPIDVEIDAATEGMRARHGWNAARAARITNLHPNRVTTWWASVESRLIDLYVDQPAETSGMLGLLLAKGEAERRRRARERKG